MVFVFKVAKGTNDLDTIWLKKRGLYLGWTWQNGLQTSLVGPKNILHTSQLKFPHRQTQGILGVWREFDREGQADGESGERGERWPGTSGRTENQLPGKTRATRSKKYATFFQPPPMCVCVCLCGWQSLKRHFSHSGTISKPAKVERTSIASSEPPQLLYCILFLSLFRLPSLFAFLLRLLPVALSRR